MMILDIEPQDELSKLFDPIICQVTTNNQQTRCNTHRQPMFGRASLDKLNVTGKDRAAQISYQCVAQILHFSFTISAGSFLMKLADDWHFPNGTASSYHNKAASRARAAGSGPDYNCFCFPRTCPHPRRFALLELRRAANPIPGKTKLHLLGLHLAIWDSSKCGQRHLCLRSRDKK